MSANARPVRIDPLEARCLLSSVAFTIDSSNSALTIGASGHVKNIGSVGLKAQDDGLDKAHYRGTLMADIGSAGIKFAGGSHIEAIDHSGSYSPANEPAAYAVDGKVKKLFISLATVKADVRDLVLDLTASSRKQRNGEKQFALRNTVITATAGTLDYKISSRFGSPDGSKSLANLKADVEDDFAKITGKPGERTITVPIVVNFSRDLANGSSARFSLTGQIVGHETATASTQRLSASPVFAAATTPIAIKRVAADVLAV